MATGRSRTRWRKRREALEKITKYADRLARDFRDKKKQAQSLAYRLEVIKAGKDSKLKIKGRNVKKVVDLINVLQSFAGAMNSALALFGHIRTVNDELTKSYRQKANLKTKKKRLKKKKTTRSNLAKLKYKQMKKRSGSGLKSEAEILKAEIASLIIEIGIVEEELKDASKEFKDAAEDYKHYKRTFKKQHKIAKRIIKDVRRRMSIYLTNANWLEQERHFTEFVRRLRERKTKNNMDKLNKWLGKYKRRYYEMF